MPHATLDPVEVLIIGAGASAAAFAWRMASAGVRIVCLEQGDWVAPGDYPSNYRDWESRQMGDFSVNPNIRNNASDYPVNDRDSPIKIANFNGVGGGTILFAGHFPRMHPSDFRLRSLDDVADDWPIDYSTLESYYALNDQMMGVAGLKGDTAYPPKDAVLAPLPLGRTGVALGRGFNELGWHWWAADSAIATTEYNGRAPCINLGHCIAGCAQGAKASVDVTYWQALANKRNVELRTRCRVREISIDANGSATGAIYLDSDGLERFQAAEVVVIAANGVGTPRLLLNSSSGEFPDGLANNSGLVGKNLMLHPYGSITGWFEQELDGYRGPHIGTWSHEFYETDATRGFVRGWTYQINRGSGPVYTALDGMTNGRIPWGAEHHAAMRRRFNHSANVVSICEDLPEEHNMVTLDPTRIDAAGVPAPKIQYTLGENSRLMLEYSLERGRELLEASGAYDIVTAGPLRHAGWHLMGTARMGSDPKRSVVNRRGQCHDVPNLFVIDGSVFVTSGGVNPTSTIQAFALYAADQILEHGIG